MLNNKQITAIASGIALVGIDEGVKRAFGLEHHPIATTFASLENGFKSWFLPSAKANESDGIHSFSPNRVCKFGVCSFDLNSVGVLVQFISSAIKNTFTPTGSNDHESTAEVVFDGLGARAGLATGAALALAFTPFTGYVGLGVGVIKFAALGTWLGAGVDQYSDHQDPSLLIAATSAYAAFYSPLAATAGGALVKEVVFRLIKAAGINHFVNDAIPALKDHHASLNDKVVHGALDGLAISTLSVATTPSYGALLANIAGGTVLGTVLAPMGKGIAEASNIALTIMPNPYIGSTAPIFALGGMVAGYNLMPEDFIGMLPKMPSNFLEDKTQAAKFAGIWLFNTVAIGGAAYYLGNPLLKAAFAPIPMAVELIYKSMIGGNPLAELTGNAAANTAFAGFAVGYGLKLFGKTLVDATYAQKEKLMDWIMPIPMYQAAAEHLIIASLCSVHMVFNYNTIKSLAIPVAGALLGAGAGWAASHSYPQYSEENLAFSAEDTIVS